MFSKFRKFIAKKLTSSSRRSQPLRPESSLSVRFMEWNSQAARAERLRVAKEEELLFGGDFVWEQVIDLGPSETGLFNGIAPDETQGEQVKLTGLLMAFTWDWDEEPEYFSLSS